VESVVRFPGARMRFLRWYRHVLRITHATSRRMALQDEGRSETREQYSRKEKARKSRCVDLKTAAGRNGTVAE
jgi:hypothetical protein